MSVEDRVATYQGEMIEFLQKLIRIPSVRGEAAPEAPFGPEVKEALQTTLAWAEKEGFKTRNVRGYAGHIEYGDGPETLGVLVHLDVVPAGEGWVHPPFGAEIHEGRIFGRGVTDDKGPAVAALYALKALKEEGIPLRRKIRIILGCDEESRWECMDAYFEEEPRPTLGFTPDAVFPLVFSEKGRLGLIFEGKVLSDLKGTRLTRLEGGSRANVVPDQATAFIQAEGSDLQRLLDIFATEITERDTVEWSKHEAGIQLTAHGRAAHASMPHLGDNALAKLIALLSRLGLKGGAWEIVNLLAKGFGAGFSGAGLEIAATDPVSGELTINLGVLHMDESSIRMEVDVRYPRNANGEHLAKRIRAFFAPVGIEITDMIVMPPHFVEENHPLVQTLMEAYRQETGDYSAPLAIGGRTYATVLGTAVAFGPGFPGQPDLAHQRDESMDIEDLVRCGRIYARALVGLAST